MLRPSNIYVERLVSRQNSPKPLRLVHPRDAKIEEMRVERGAELGREAAAYSEGVIERRTVD